MKQKHIKILASVGTVAILNFGSAWADDVYNSTSWNKSLLQMTDGLEVGNEITITPGYNWSMNEFQIEYYAPDTVADDVGVDLRFYLNNGASQISYTNPGSLFFDSGWTYNTGGSLMSAGSHNLVYSSSDLASGWQTGVVPGDFIPGDFTFTITFTNLDDSSVIDLPLANSQSTLTSTNYGDYWVNNDGNWELMTNSVPANFLVDITGQVPEPSTFGLAAIGSLALLGINRLRRKS